MLAWLVLVLGLQHATAVLDIPKDTNYIIRKNATCFDSGFFFQRESVPNSLDDTCYLCFCQDQGTAVCWRRENRKCDLEHYQEFGTRNSRSRRSPLSLGDVFLRDAARDFFNKQSPEQCKPFESSFSDGCPPADWCIGCTVCDCDANGHWDCHILSFCTDKNGKNQMKKRRGRPRNRNAKKQSKTTKPTNAVRSTKITTKPPKKPAGKRSANPKAKRNQVKQSSAVNKHKINPVKATTINKISAVKKPLAKVQAKKSIPSRNKVTKRPLYIKKNISTNKPLNMKSNSDKSVKNNTVEVAQKVVKQFMSTMQKMIKSIDSKTNKTTTKQMNKVVRKRSMPKHGNKMGTKTDEQKQKLVTKPVTNINRKNRRIRRQATTVDDGLNKNYSNYLHNWNENNTNINRNINRTQNLVVNNSHILNNETASNTLLKNSMNRDIYITESQINIDNQPSIVSDGTLYQNVNNTGTTVLWVIDNYSTTQQNISKTNLEDAILLNTDRSYLSSNIKKSNVANDKSIDLKENLPEKIRYHVNTSYETETKYSNASTQTESNNCKFRTLLHKLIGIDTDKYNNTKESYEAAKKPKRYTILTKIKRLFKKIFNKKDRNKFYHKDDFYYSDPNIKHFDYKKPKNDDLETNVKEKLRLRVYELKKESENILKTIGIIKGLLHILEISTNGTKLNVSNDFYGTNQNIDKLKIIVKNSYYIGDNAKNLTDDQRTQISYIKNNVGEFIKSIGKFARILDDVIRIAMHYNKKEYKIENAQRNKSIYAINNMVKDYSNMTYTKVEKLKKLIFNYNILQNRFIRQIYIILNNLDAKINKTYNLQPTVSSKNYMELNRTDAIETNSANIIKNIRKLKMLAEKITGQRRAKRETIDNDDALEYLLILMEYLLKRHSLSYPSVNDGLDLLIEAIKSAPDIKLNGKKVLVNTTEEKIVTRTSVPVNPVKKYDNYSTSNTSREYKNKNKHKINNIDQSDDDIDDDEDKIEEIYRSFKSKYSTEQNQDGDLLGSSNTSISNEYNNVQEDTTRTSRDNNNDEFRNKVHDSFEEDIATFSSRSITVETDATSANPVTDNVMKEVKGKSDTDNFQVDSKANIDWIEENFKEIKALRETEITSTISKSLSLTRTYKPYEKISDVSKENKKYDEKNLDISSTEEIISKKQLDLLNSLDYNEDDTESKDDKFLSDTYA